MTLLQHTHFRVVLSINISGKCSTYTLGNTALTTELQIRKVLSNAVKHITIDPDAKHNILISDALDIRCKRKVNSLFTMAVSVVLVLHSCVNSKIIIYKYWMADGVIVKLST